MRAMIGTAVNAAAVAKNVMKGMTGMVVSVSTAENAMTIYFLTKNLTNRIKNTDAGAVGTWL